MRKFLIAALGASLLTVAFASDASAQRRGFGFYGGGWRAGGWGLGWRGGGWGYRPLAWRAGGWGVGRRWAFRNRPFLWGAAAFGTAAALAYAASDPYYSYGYGGYGYAPPLAYTGYPVQYGSGYYAFASCGTTSRLIWNGWAYRRVWVRTC